MSLSKMVKKKAQNHLPVNNNKHLILKLISSANSHPFKPKATEYQLELTINKCYN